MLSNKIKTFNLPGYIISSFDELSIFKSLSAANISKRNGTDVKTIFTLIFSLVFHSHSYNQLINSKYHHDLPSKDSVYRFLSNSKFNWRKFLTLVSAKIIAMIDVLTDHHRVNVFIVDDSPYNRSRSKKTEMLSTIFDHASHKFYNGYHLLTLGWSDGATFVPVDFSLCSTVKKLINGIDETLDKRTLAYKRRSECLEKKTDLTVAMIKRALDNGIYASYVLMDSWFSSSKMFKNIKSLGIDMIGMLKITTKQFFVYKNKQLNIKTLFDRSLKYGRKTRIYNGIISGLTVKTVDGVQVRIVFVVNRNKKSEWLAIASSDLTVSDEEIIRIYEKRWSIECFFKAIKSTFRLEKEFQVNSFDSLIAHTTIVFIRYMVVSWEIRKSNDIKTLGKLFIIMCDDIRDITFIEAIETLLNLIHELSNSCSKTVQRRIDKMVEKWYSLMPEWLIETLHLSITV